MTLIEGRLPEVAGWAICCVVAFALAGDSVTLSDESNSECWSAGS